MVKRVSILIFSLLTLGQIGILLVATFPLLMAIVLKELLSGHLVSAIYFAGPMFGGAIGLLAACSTLQRLIGKPTPQPVSGKSRIGLIVGIATVCYVIWGLDPHPEPLLWTWLPGVLGGSMLFVLSFTANKPLKPLRPSASTRTPIKPAPLS